ncbi:MAG: 4-alpha-glucanotransferase, partial [Nocardioidaceae bacterium]|nr:4-alpha-glucanotransferase [Nocardioidaceae bacterium]
VIAAHRLLARAPSTLLTATLEDLVAQRARPNLPGATQRPNWSLPLPVLVDDLPTHPLVAAVTGVFASALTGGTADSEAP